MTEESARLRMPYLSAAQAQKHVTHNEALTLLDTLVQLAVLDKDLTEPPADPEEGDCYIVAAPATGEWIGWDKRIARYIDGTWRSYLPGTGGGAGWLAWVMDEDAMYRFDGTDWALAGIEGPAGPAGAAGAQGPAGPVGPAGATSLTICRLVATSNLALASALEAGDTVDGVTLVEGDRILVAGQTDETENGVYLVPASGAASRDPGFAAFDDHAGVYFSVMEGSANADTLWRCTSNRGGTIDSSDLVFTAFTSGGGTPPNKQLFTSSGTWTKPDGLARIKVTVVGGGGAGGGSAAIAAGESSMAGGGGAGGTAIKWIEAASLAATVAVTIGAGGTPVAGGTGGTGGTSSFGSHASATGGLGGQSVPAHASALGFATPGAGGTASSGDINAGGGAGNPGTRNPPGGVTGSGASGTYGGGGGARTGSDGTGAGAAGSGYGAGGGGAGGVGTGGTGSVALPGGAGRPGLVIVEEFFG